MEIEEAINNICKNVNIKKEIIEVPLYDSYGMVCAEDIISNINVPAFPKSAMDGYAIRASDVINATKDNPAELNVIGELFAGDYKEYQYEQNSAIRIMTGSYIPDGYDCVVMQENTDYGMDKVKIYAPVSTYANYCHVGENLKAGDVLAKAGELIDEIKAAIIASAGIGSIKVVKPVKVAIIATGSELIEPGEDAVDGKIYDTISYLLIGKIKKACIPFNTFVDYTIVEDDENAITSEINNRLELYDIIITTGGVSVGKKDLLKDILKKISVNIIVSDVNIQPGTPTLVSEKDGKIILSLSGNPYAALANFDMYFYPLLSEVTGCKLFDNEVVDAILQSPYEKINKRRRLVRAYYEDGKVYIRENMHSSSIISNLANCNCYIDIKEGTKLNIEDTVKVRKFGGF